ncbi:TetR/AcrR family transcriptional regulator [Halopseudomonas salina]|uniref:TetR family transcriptional regulator n=1 Tax=Halopseudomonas salina TaxID=1323744 RepID=A0ABQ1PFQ1_9GAMM|nr:TetR/AcrR family transcriptional regulator [Halopseudomonas salina]GGC96346.1 TetR family transcriptional regulator [Halopseudomonas salina]
MKTRERILQCALELFNEHGEPNVTTLDIATELDISPGNLYYHFRGKEALLEELLADFLDQTHGLLHLESRAGPLEPEDYWLFLHLLFESIIAYRFLFQDLSNLIGRYTVIARSMRQWVDALRSTLKRLLLDLHEQQRLLCDAQALERLLDALCQTVLFWLDYQRVSQREDDEPTQAVQQVLGLLLPYLETDTRHWMSSLIQRYN